MRDLVPWPGIEPQPPAMGARRLNHWATRAVPRLLNLHTFWEKEERWGRVTPSPGQGLEDTAPSQMFLGSCICLKRGPQFWGKLELQGFSEYCCLVHYREKGWWEWSRRWPGHRTFKSSSGDLMCSPGWEPLSCLETVGSAPVGTQGDWQFYREGFGWSLKLVWWWSCWIRWVLGS